MISNAERRRLRDIAYRALPENKEKARLRSAAWYANPANKAKRRASIAEYRGANAEYVRSAEAKRYQARKAKNPVAFQEYYRRYYYLRGGCAENRRRRKLPEPKRPEPPVCECCGGPPGKRALNLDHDHVTGQFRGWLCGRCNTSIGGLGDDITGLQRAIAYLERSV